VRRGCLGPLLSIADRRSGRPFDAPISMQPGGRAGRPWLQQWAASNSCGPGRHRCSRIVHAAPVAAHPGCLPPVFVFTLQGTIPPTCLGTCSPGVSAIAAADRRAWSEAQLGNEAQTRAFRVQALLSPIATILLAPKAALVRGIPLPRIPWQSGTCFQADVAKLEWAKDSRERISTGNSAG